jgi:hypothetical protein
VVELGGWCSMINSAKASSPHLSLTTGKLRAISEPGTVTSMGPDQRLSPAAASAYRNQAGNIQAEERERQ